MIEARNLTKRYGSDDRGGRPQLRRETRPGNRLPRPQRGGQDDDDAASSSGSTIRTAVRSPSPASATATSPLPSTRSGRCSTPRPCTAGAPPTTICCAWPRATASRPGGSTRCFRSSGLESVARRRASGFSLGMGQRLGIAAALLGDPAVLMFDEPVNGLDPEGIVWVRTLMRALAAEGRTVLVSSHLMSEMALTADHLIVIGRGRLIRDEGVNEFIESSSQHSVRVSSPQRRGSG